MKNNKPKKRHFTESAASADIKISSADAAVFVKGVLTFGFLVAVGGGAAGAGDGGGGIVIGILGDLDLGATILGDLEILWGL